MIGFLWSIEKKENVYALPSMNEIFYGLYSFIANFLKEKLEQNDQKKIWIEQCTQCYKAVFDYILRLTDFDQDGDRPLELTELKNPYSRATCLILYLTAMEAPFTIEL